MMAHALVRTLHDGGCGPIDMLAPRWSHPLVAAMPEVRRSILMPLGHGRLGLWTRRRLGRQLRGGYSRAIVLPNSWKSALVPWFAAIPVRTGWRGEMRYGLLNDMRILDPEALPSVAQRYTALALPAACGLPPVPAPRLAHNGARAAALRRHLRLDGRAPAVAMAPGAEFGPAKQWPPEHYGQVAAALLRRGWQVWILGSSRDAPAGAQLVAQVPQSLRPALHDLCGRTSLEQAIDLIGEAALMVSNDSGLMHIAAALQCPQVAIFGPTSPLYTPPLQERVRIVRRRLDCSPCRARTCPLGHHDCMRGLAPERILAAIADLAPATP